MVLESSSAHPAKVPFAKMHGTGNDFVVFDCRHKFPFDLAQFAPFLSHRRHGVGADGVIGLYPSKSAEFKMVYFNADGSETICGNGMRCLARYIHSQGLVPPERKSFELETLKGPVSVKVGSRSGPVGVKIGRPVFDGAQIPTMGQGEFIEGELEVTGLHVVATAVGMGNPHCVVFVDALEGYPVADLGPALESHHFFPERANVEFVEFTGENQVRMRVWERGVGETEACGTGACAVLAAAHRTERCGRRLLVETSGGDVEASWDETSGEMTLIGAAEIVYMGELDVRYLQDKVSAIGS